MKRSFKLQDLDCAACASKMQDAIAKLPGVNSASISFMTSKLVLDADDARFPEVLDEAQKAIRRIERDCIILR